MSSVSGRKYRLHTLVWTLFVQPSDFKPRSSDYSESISNSLVTSSAVLTDTTALDASATAYGRFKVFLMVFSGPSGLYNLDKENGQGPEVKIHYVARTWPPWPWNHCEC